MSIKDDAGVEAERRYPRLNPDADELTYPRSAIRRMMRDAFEAGAAWASEQADREPSDAESTDEAEALYPHNDDADPGMIVALRSAYRAGVDREGRAALLAAQEVRDAD